MFWNLFGAGLFVFLVLAGVSLLIRRPTEDYCGSVFEESEANYPIHYEEFVESSDPKKPKKGKK